MAGDDGKTLKGQVTKQGQDALGRLAQDLIKTPVVSGALSTVFEARERAVRAQELTMGALGIPSAADIERLTRRLRSVSQRLEGLEEGIDRILEKLDKRVASTTDVDVRLANLEAAVARIEDLLASR
ncbi:MAG TPA: hypothetical protein VME01_07510 [Solirubrobacteraceae bacterium]|nr:hypothetical protein [Solirubrobacteraceae bacterium]